jgi:RNA polymerase sigma-70 factor, ECF subfamily
MPRKSEEDDSCLRSGDHPPDAELLARSAAGDRQAFERIVSRYGALALRVAARLAPDRSSAEDFAQEAFVRVWTRAADFDARRARFSTWLYRIVVNLAIDERRRSRPERLSEKFEAVDPSPGAEERLALDERYRALWSARQALPSRQRAALVLVYDEGLSGAEAAEVLGVSIKAVERLLARARAHLRERLQPGMDPQERRA